MPERLFYRRRDGVAYLVGDRPDAYVPCSRYGRTATECAPVAWRVAYLVSRESNGRALPISAEELDYAMGLVVNDHDDVEYMVRTYGRYDYGRC